jgi:hypothetical protein
VTAVDGVLHGDWRAQLALLFKIFDRDGSGGVDKTELAAVVRDALRAERLRARDDVIAALVDAVFRDYDIEGDGILSFAEFDAWLGHEPQARCAHPCCAVLCALKHCPLRALTRHHRARRRWPHSWDWIRCSRCGWPASLRSRTACAQEARPQKTPPRRRSQNPPGCASACAR